MLFNVLCVFLGSHPAVPPFVWKSYLETNFPGLRHLMWSQSGDAYGAACNGCQAVCDDCVEPPLVPQCTDVMLNTASEGGPITLEMVSIDKGYWRATNSSREVLACFNADACVGGLTGTADYCLEGYEGPCECSVPGASPQHSCDDETQFAGHEGGRLKGLNAEAPFHCVGR